MKKIICFVMALMVSMALAMPAAATADSPEHKPSEPSSSLKTGDAITLWIGTMGASATGLAAVVARRKKEQ